MPVMSSRYQRDVEEFEIESDEEEEEMQGVGRRVRPSTNRRPSPKRFDRMNGERNGQFHDDDEESEEEDDEEIEMVDFE